MSSSSSSSDDETPLGYSGVNDSVKRKDKQAVEEHKMPASLTPGGEDYGSSPYAKSNKNYPPQKGQRSSYEESQGSSSLAIGFLEDIQVEVLPPESENLIYVKYFYIVEVKRKTAQYRLRRSYTMFEWLYHRLVMNNKGHVIPKIPPKNFRSNLPMAPIRLLEERRAKFNRFLRDCLSKFKSWPVSDDLYHFLKSEDTHGGYFINYMTSHPFSASKDNSSIARKMGKSISDGIYKTKESLWDKFQYAPILFLLIRF
jgi:PX domain